MRSCVHPLAGVVSIVIVHQVHSWRSESVLTGAAAVAWLTASTIPENSADFIAIRCNQMKASFLFGLCVSNANGPPNDDDDVSTGDDLFNGQNLLHSLPETFLFAEQIAAESVEFFGSFFFFHSGKGESAGKGRSFWVFFFTRFALMKRNGDVHFELCGCFDFKKCTLKRLFRKLCAHL